MVRVVLSSGIIALGLIGASAQAQLGVATGAGVGVGASVGTPALDTSINSNVGANVGATAKQDGNSTLKSAVRKSRRDATGVGAGAAINSRAEVKTQRPSGGGGN